MIEEDIYLKRKTSDFSIFGLKNTGSASENHVHEKAFDFFCYRMYFRKIRSFNLYHLRMY